MRQYLAIAVTLLLLVFGASALANDSDKQIINDKRTDDVLKTCFDHKRAALSWVTKEDLSSPNYSDDKIVSWVTAALPNIMSLDYAKMQQELLGGEKYFTPDGWCECVAALSDANVIDATITKKLEFSMILHGTPKITKRFSEGGIFVWLVETPVSFVSKSAIPPHASGSPDIDGEVLILRVSRSSAKTNLDGIGISQWVTVKEAEYRSHVSH